MKKFNYKIFLKYLFTYICVIVAFIVIIIPIYKTMYHIIKENTIESESEKVFDEVSILDSKIEKILTISLHLKNSAAFHNVSGITGDLETHEYLYLPNAQKELNELRERYDLDLHMYALFKNNNIIISDVMVAPDYHEVFRNYLKYEKMPLDTIKGHGLTADKETMIFLPSQSISYFDGAQMNGLTCITKANLLERPGSVADYMMFYTINLDTLIRSLGVTVDDSNEFLLITDPKGNILFNCNYDGEAIQADNSRIQEQTLNGKRYTLICGKTEYGNLNVVKGVANSVFEGKIQAVLQLVKIYIISAIILSLLFSLLFSFRQFRGMREIFFAIKRKLDVPVRKNEYKYIVAGVSGLSAENARYEEEIKDVKQAMRFRLIEKMFLQGIYTEYEKAEFKRYVGDKIEFFCVVVIAFIWERDFVPSEEEMEKHSRIIQYIKGELGRQYRRLVDMNNGIEEFVVLIPMQENVAANCENICLLMQRIVEDIYGYPVEIGISNIGRDIENVHSCYQQAKRAIRQIDGRSEFPVRMVSNLYDDADIFEEFNIERQLYELIMTENKEAIEKLFQRLARRFKTHPFSSEQEIMQSFFIIRNPIANARKSILKADSEVELPKYDESATLIELLENLEEAARQLCDYSIRQKNIGEHSLKATVLDYLNQEYADCNLSAGVVAEHFSVSEKYIFKVVKEATDMPYGKYVERIRLQEAQRLLHETELSAAEIAQQVGFYSIATFYKAFKRVFGVAPIEWRNSLGR